MLLGVRERIIAIRLMDMVIANPAAAEKLGIVVINGSGVQNDAGSESGNS